MTRQYMDFAPVKKKTATTKASNTSARVNVTPNNRVKVQTSGTRRVTATRTTTVNQPNVAKQSMVSSSGARSASTRTVPTGTGNVAMMSAGNRRVNTSVRRTTVNSNTQIRKSQVKLGEIEDLNPKFVTTSVPKRPLGDGTSRPISAQEEVKSAKQKKIGGRLKSKKAAKEAQKQVKTQRKVAVGGSYEVPKSPFINQDKVVKRPLSKNVYQQKQIVAPVEKKTNGKPVTIITKPKKDSKVGLVVTIILTIILGAVAGTVAFLLLPK